MLEKIPGGVCQVPFFFFLRGCVLALHYVLDAGSKVMLTAIIMPPWFHVSISDRERSLLAPGMTSEDTLQMIIIWYEIINNILYLSWVSKIGQLYTRYTCWLVPLDNGNSHNGRIFMPEMPRKQN